ncbi:MAG: S1C family serine protease [Fidelibacterota bacterium]
MSRLRYSAKMSPLAISVVVIAGLIMIPALGLSQEIEDGDEMDQVLKEMERELEEVEDELGEAAREVRVEVRAVLDQGDRKGRGPKPLFGVYLDDLDFEDAYEMHYPENYGVLIDGVIRGGNADRAGLREGDIIMEFDGEKVRYEDHLLRMRNAKSVGDTVEITFFRDGQVLSTGLVFLPPEDLDEETARELGVQKRKLSPGHGGGGFEPVFINLDGKGINDFLKVNGFDGIPAGPVVAWGGGGAGNVGKGWFVGGMGAGFEKREQVAVKDPVTGKPEAWKSYKLETGFGGVTLTKKFPIFTERFILDAGVMLGGGSTKLWVSQTDGDLTWTDAIDDKNSYSVRFEKRYFVYYPSVGLLVRIKDWLGIHGSLGYLGTYAGDDKWTEKPFDFTVGGPSPTVPSGPSFTLGIWFGN